MLFPVKAACPFCDLKDRSAVVYQDARCFALMSQRPINPFHTLVIPNGHFERFSELPDDVVSHLFLVARKISQAVALVSKADFITHWSDDDLKGSGINLVSHYKFHIIPRFQNDRVVIEWNREEDVNGVRQREDAQILRTKLREAQGALGSDFDPGGVRGGSPA
jgi:histidine triad (HIT) family protein